MRAGLRHNGRCDPSLELIKLVFLREVSDRQEALSVPDAHNEARDTRPAFITCMKKCCGFPSFEDRFHYLRTRQPLRLVNML